jgi:HD-GYP domain-containing protein (c-di-GMP phosphodiesterase class II)
MPDVAPLPTVMALARSCHFRDPLTGRHVQRVAHLSLMLGRAVGLAAEELLLLQVGALLHDVGKLALPDAVLLKPGPLTADEAAQAGEAAPFLARIVALADVFEALTGERPYRRGLSADQACDVLAGGAGSHFDPALTAAFLGLRPRLTSAAPFDCADAA